MAIYINAVAPESIRVTVTRGGGTFDFTTATAASFDVSKPDGLLASWPATIISAAADAITLEHVFDAGDVPEPGAYWLVPRLVVSGGFVRGKKVILPIEDPFRR